LTVSYVVTPSELEALRKIRNSAYEAGKGINHAVDMPLRDPAPDSVLMFGMRYRSSGKPGTKTYSMNQNDLRGILRHIRNGKMFGDFMVATIHAHQGPWIAQRWAYEDEPPDFLIELARQSIDNGADAFVGHGPHLIRGIEIYKGKPIFYSLGEFFRQMELTVTYNPDPSATLTDVELLKQNWERGDTRAPIMYESLLTESRYQDGKLVEVRLHPIDAQYDAPISRTGVPRIASPEMGRRILERVQTLSKPFGTTIAIEGNVGIIRVTQQSATAGK
jgi:poly-gamma-glutamate synthesis protein (capsule biosynthesis protein)